MSRVGSPSLAAAPDGGLAARVHSARSLVARHRRAAAAVSAGAAVLAAVSALTPAPAGGSATAGETSRAAGERAALPAGSGSRAVASARQVAVTVRLADPAGVLLLRPGVHVEVLGGPPAGAAGVPVGGDVGTGDADVLVPDAVVLDVPQPAAGDAGGALLGAGAADTAGGSQGLAGVVVLSVGPLDAHRLAGAAGSRPLSLAVALAEP